MAAAYFVYPVLVCFQMFTQDIVDISGGGKFSAADTLHDNLQGIPHFALHVDRNPVFQVVRPQELRSIFRDVVFPPAPDAGASLIPCIGGRFSLRPVKKAIRSSPRRIRLFMCFFVIT